MFQDIKPRGLFLAATAENMKHMKQTSRSFIRTFLLCLVPLSMLLGGCASTSEQAESLIREGRVDEALSLVERVRRIDSTDSDDIGLERRVRLEWISAKLIEVRLSRLADNKGASTELMRKILKNQTEWSLIPTGAVYATQFEETGYLSESIQRGIYESLEKKQPLAALVRFQTDRALLEDVLKIETTKLKLALADSGRSFCQTESKSLGPTDFYRTRFLNEACRKLQHTIVVRKTENSVRLFGDLKVDLKLENVPSERISDFSRDLKAEFEKSIWHDPSGKKELALKLTGDLTEKISERGVYRSKQYTVRVPYEETRVEKRSERTGLQTVFEVLAWALTTYQPNRERDNGDGTVTITETKYRDSTRLFPYQATEVTQDLGFQLEVELSPEGTAHRFEFREKLKTESDEHNVRFADAGLSPQVRRLTAPSDWLLSLNRKLMDRISAEFNEAWIKRFCGETMTTALSVIEFRHRCVYGANGHAPSITREWFANRYGIEIETWRQMVAQRPL